MADRLIAAIANGINQTSDEARSVRDTPVRAETRRIQQSVFKILEIKGAEVGRVERAVRLRQIGRGTDLLSDGRTTACKGGRKRRDRGQRQSVHCETPSKEDTYALLGAEGSTDSSS